MSQQPRSISNNNTQQQYYEQQQQQNEYQLNPQQQQQTAKQLHQLPMQQSQSDQDNDQDILDKIDSLLLQNQSQSINTSENQLNNNKSSQRQMLLNFKITQLQKIINNLNLANKKLRNQLDEQQEYLMNSNNLNNNGNSNNNNNKNNDSSNSNILNNSSTSQSPFTDQLTQMHGQFQQIQHLITQYKQQLAASEKKWNIIKQQKDQQIDSLKSQLIQISQNKDVLESEMQRLVEENQMLKVKNQQLLIQVDNLQMYLENANQKRQQQYLQQQQHQQNYMLPSHQYMSPSQQQQPTSPRYYQRKFDQFQDYRFNQKIQRQMQNMIKKLLKQLSNEKKINTRMSMQIKRLNNQVIQMQKKIKLKNDANYQLEMKIIHMEKMYRGGYGNMNMNNNVGNNNSNKPLSYLTNIKNTPLTPSQSNKNQSRVYTNNKNEPRTTQQQQKLKPREQMMNMKDYQAYNQYTDQSDRNNNNYDDYVVTSVPLKSTRSPGKGKQQQQQYVANNNTQQQQQAHNFIKPKKQPQQPKSKNNNNISTYHHQQQKHQQKPSPSQPQNSNDKSLLLNRQFMSFTIMQLEQGKIKITMKQKIIIISKLIELYCKKIRTQNYQNLTVQEIQVYNFNDKHPNLVRIRVVSSAGSKTDISTGVHEENEQSLMYNLAFIVESLVKDVQTIDRQDLQVDLNLSEIIEDILNKNMEQKIAYFQQLSKSLENSVMNLV